MKSDCTESSNGLCAAKLLWADQILCRNLCSVAVLGYFALPFLVTGPSSSCLSLRGVWRSACRLSCARVN
jgi:hypothetical protein